MDSGDDHSRFLPSPSQEVWCFLLPYGQWLAMGFLGFVVGCGMDATAPKRMVHGTITCGGERPGSGRIRLVPIEGTSGPAAVAKIEDGQYCLDARGGIVPGKYRVEIRAFKRTGRKVPGPSALENQTTLVEEKRPLVDPRYSGPKSPLTIDIAAESDAPVDILVPAP